MISERYSRNTESFSPQELELIAQKRVCVIGCGGLGGHVCQSLVRFGVMNLTIVDGDVFVESNLNRQVFSNMETLGSNKAEVAKAELKRINPDVSITALPYMLEKENAAEILSGHDIAIDCLDRIAPRFILRDGCRSENIPMIYGAIGGFYGQVSVIYPEDDTLDQIYPHKQWISQGIEKKWGNPPFTPQVIAGVQTAEALKLLAGRKTYLRHAVLHLDLLCHAYEIVPLQTDRPPI